MGALGYLFGIAIGDLIFFDLFFLYLAFLAAVTALIFLHRYKRIKIFSVILLLLFSGIFRSSLEDSFFNSKDSISAYVDKTLTINGNISESPDVRDNHQRVILSRITTENGRRLSGNILVLLSRNEIFTPHPECPDLEVRYELDEARSEGNKCPERKLVGAGFTYGENLTVKCALEFPSDDYGSYLMRRRIYAICPFPNFTARGEIENPLLGKIFSGVEFLKNNINSSLHEPYSSLMAGILLGDRRGFGEALTEAFKRVGLTHIVALSGYNVSIIVAIAMVLGRHIGISRRILFIGVTFLLFLFVIATGASPSAVRAGIMGWLVLVAYEVGRLGRPLNLLLLTAVIMVTFEPKILLWDVGWQLSFAATYAVLTIPPLLQDSISRYPNPLNISDMLVITISAIVFTLPLTLFHFGGWSIIAPLANLLVLPVIPVIMALGGFMSILGDMTFLSFLWNWPAWILLRYIVTVSETLSSIPLSYRTFDNVPFLFMLLAYMFLGAVVWKIKKRTYDRKRA